MIKRIILCLIFSVTVFSSESIENEYEKVFLNQGLKYQNLKIDDPISKEPINTIVKKVSNKNGKSIGFIREVSTTTGCNDGCLPVIFSLLYNEKGKFLKLLSKEGLTKKNHRPFKKEDYFKLELIITGNPQSLKKVNHPKEMVDAITSETSKEYKGDVIKEAAYTTLRVYKYHQHTKKFLERLVLLKKAESK